MSSLQDGTQALLVTKGTRGDLVPFLAMGEALRNAGWQVTLVSNAGYRDMARSVSLDFVALDSQAEFERFLADTTLLASPLGVETFARQHAIGKIDSEFRLMQELCAAKPTVILNRYMSGFAIPMIGELRRIPIATVYTAALQVPGRRLFQELCRTRLQHEINCARQAVGLPDVTNWRSWIDQAELHIACWPDWFDDASEDSGIQLYYLGFPASDSTEEGPLPDDVLRLLNRSVAPVLITGGTARWTLAPQFYAAAAHGCAVLGRPGILVTPFDDFVPNPLPPGVSRFKSLPFRNLMPHLGAVIHHAGSSVMVRAMRACVPQLTMPFGADRPDTARRLTRLGVARCVAVRDWQPDKIAAELRTLIEDPAVGISCRDTAQRLAESERLSELSNVLQRVTRESDLTRRATP